MGQAGLATRIGQAGLATIPGFEPFRLDAHSCARAGDKRIREGELLWRIRFDFWLYAALLYGV
jgi:hypothetical protein